MNDMHFSSKPEAYTYIIYTLTQWLDSYSAEVSTVINQSIESVKIAYENHEQDTDNIRLIIMSLLRDDILFPHHQNEIEVLASSLSIINDNKTNDNNVLQRRFESELVSCLIQNPTHLMMSSIHLVSHAIIKTINEYRQYSTDSKEQDILNYFLSELEGSDIVFGCFKERPTLDKVIAILEENNPNDFIKIQFISFMFARSVIGPLPLNNLPPQTPTGLFARILELYLKTNPIPEDEQPFSYQRMAAEKNNIAVATDFRTFITSKLFYGDELYTQGQNRGRLGPRKTHLNTNQLGLMKLEQSAHSRGLPIIADQVWCADAQAQEAQEDSIYYQTALLNDCPYITGPSGMTSIFMNMMFLLLNPQEIELIQAYSLGITAYIVGAGFHSVNEILIPLVKCINMLPDYPAYQGLEYLIKPPLYNLYFDRISQFDSEFNQRRHQVWANYLNYFASCYMPLCMNDFCEAEQIAAAPCLSPEVEVLKEIVASSIDDCIQFHNNSKGTDFRFLAAKPQESTDLNLLKEACLSQSSLIAIMAQLQKYFAGEFETSPTAMHKFDNRSYLRFFLYTLKDYPQVLSHINEQLALEPPLIIDTTKDIFSQEYRTECFKVHKMLKEEHHPGGENLNNEGFINSSIVL
ncbi:hypothetical protein BN59_00368 [Legionella massiliensis]|uniref:Uncharacterized protein n=1 Tax=Legionella massiliensis TaxID=1034943 RepID=A0A078KWH7_9GAMM|nr:hypothetical protein [Legionella massiliensis]CDZ76104.1 hypothetical protein BN59_00368 [Legionella massiliensis]CEE11842.1 hypothetical protein BN1094_00368 [Legionella massiliensis]